MVNQLGEEMAHNRAMLRRCNKIYKWTFICYAAIFVPCAIASLFCCFLYTIGFGELMLILLDGLVLKGAMFVCGLLGAYRKNDRFAAAVPIIALVDALAVAYPQFAWMLGVLGVPVNAFIFVGSAVMAVVNVRANRKYKWLEEQYGFPYFNELTSDYELDRVQRNIKDEYMQKVEKLRKTQVKDMDEVTVSGTVEANTDVKQELMNDVSAADMVGDLSGAKEDNMGET